MPQRLVLGSSRRSERRPLRATGISLTRTPRFREETPATTTTVPPAMTCPTTDPPSGATGSGCAVLVVPGSSAPDDENVTVTGTGVIDVNPKAMVTEADPSDFGPVIIRLDSTQLWELGSDDGGGLAPGPSDGSTPGQAISGFASLVESTLGAREGAVAMLGIASPTGYLVLDEQEITSVAPTGQGTIDGKPVTEYRVSADASQLENDPSATAEELTTIRAAIAKLQSQGLSGTGTDVAVDAQGFIVQSITTYQFSDGGSVTVKADFSNFGCAGTVLMPGQVGPTTPPANCVSPDTPVSTTTSTTNATTTTSSSPSTTSTTVRDPDDYWHRTDPHDDAKFDGLVDDLHLDCWILDDYDDDCPLSAAHGFGAQWPQAPLQEPREREHSTRLEAGPFRCRSRASRPCVAGGMVIDGSAHSLARPDSPAGLCPRDRSTGEYSAGQGARASSVCVQSRQSGEESRQRPRQHLRIRRNAPGRFGQIKGSKPPRVSSPIPSRFAVFPSRRLFLSVLRHGGHRERIQRSVG